jgi:hypothetical protein
MKHKHHIIPKHMGGSDDSSNLIELTPEEHAEAHRKLYEEHGHWQDYVAWQGLAKLATKEEHVFMLLSEAGRKGNAIRNANGGNKGMKYNRTEPGNYKDRKGANNPCAKEFVVVHSDGTREQVKALKTWCESKGLNYNSFHNQCVGRKKSHKGYSILF